MAFLSKPRALNLTLAALLAAGAGSVAMAQSSAGTAAAPIHLKSTPETVIRGVIDPGRAPVLKIKSGQIVSIDTVSHGGLQDDPVAFFAAAGIPKTGVLKDAIDIAKMPRVEGFGGHVLTGPIYVEGAEPGDMLEVRIIKIEPRVPYGVNNPGPGGAAPGLVAERASKVIKFDMKRRVALFSDKIEFPLRPFMGIMAVAPPPKTGKVSSKAPGNFGGNMDFKELSDGSTLYLPLYNPGGLFVTGDSHAAQGDGEVDGNAIEASMNATLQFILHKGAGAKMKYPYVEDAKNYFVLGMDEDLDKALTSSITETVEFLKTKKGMTATDAYSLTSVAIDFGIAEAVDQNLVVYGKIPKSLFKTSEPYWAKK